jgi:hypothetical protein
MTENDEGSEYGAGIVVCLAKFTEHLWTREPGSAGELSDLSRAIMRPGDTKAKLYSHEVERWANGASDHFYDLDERAPEPLKELASLTLRMGHGFTGETWTADDMGRVRALWKESCLAVDEMLGIEDPDWGRW